MRAVDTNVIARFLLADDAKQYAIACDVMRGDVLILWGVLLEVVWLLPSRYAMPRPQIVRLIRYLADLPSVHIADTAFVEWAMTRFEAGADFADMMHLAEARDTAGFATFDRGIARHAGPDAPVPVETLSA